MKAMIFLILLCTLFPPESVAVEFDSGVDIAPFVQEISENSDRAPLPEGLLSAVEVARRSTVCFLKGIEDSDCVYSCRDGRVVRVPVREPLPGDRGPVLACSQILIPLSHRYESAALGGLPPGSRLPPSSLPPHRRIRTESCSFSFVDSGGTCHYTCGTTGVSVAAPFTTKNPDGSFNCVSSVERVIPGGS